MEKCQIFINLTSFVYIYNYVKNAEKRINFHKKYMTFYENSFIIMYNIL